jgi:hypothetical protein
MTRTLVLTTFVLAACQGGKGYLEVTLAGDAVAISGFTVTATLQGATLAEMLTPPSPVNLPFVFAITTSPPRSGTLHVQVEAHDAGGTTLATGEGDGPLTASAVTHIAITMIDTLRATDMAVGGDLAQADMAVGGDLAQADMAVSTDLLQPDLLACGRLGEPCCTGGVCTDGTRCLAGVTSSRCAAFAGGFELGFTSAGCGTTACSGNPYASGACACPIPFTAAGGADIDEGCAAGATNATTAFSLCGITTLPSRSDWGGAYLVDDGFMSCTTNKFANPITGGNSCPVGAEAVSLRVFLPTTNFNGGSCPNGYVGGTLVVCLMSGAPVTTLAGVFESYVVDGACRVASASAAGCVCPAKTVKVNLQSVVDRVGDMATTIELANITLCLAQLP